MQGACTFRVEFGEVMSTADIRGRPIHRHLTANVVARRWDQERGAPATHTTGKSADTVRTLLQQTHAMARSTIKSAQAHGD